MFFVHLATLKEPGGQKKRMSVRDTLQNISQSVNYSATHLTLRPWERESFIVLKVLLLFMMAMY